jgi:hypothetical protein
MGWRLVSEAEIQEQAALYRELVAVAADGPDRFDAAYWWLRSARVSFSRRSYGSPDAKHEALIPWEALVQRAAVAQRDAAERIDAVLPQELIERSRARLTCRAKYDAATVPLDRLSEANAWARWSSRQLDKYGNRRVFEAAGIDVPAAQDVRDQVMEEAGLRLAGWMEEMYATEEGRWTP